jgi:glutaminase A
MGCNQSLQNGSSVRRKKLDAIVPIDDDGSELKEARDKILELRKQLDEAQRRKKSASQPASSSENQSNRQQKLLNRRSALFLKLASYDDVRGISSKNKANSFPVPSKHDRLLYNKLCGAQPVLQTAVVRRQLLDSGLLFNDRRIQQVYLNLDRMQSIDIWELTIFLTNSTLVNKALNGGLAISNFAGFCASIDDAFHKTSSIKSGNVASYIPSLARADPEKYTVSVCSVSGQQYEIGDTDERFCVQSCSKPITYCIACELKGSEKVHKHIGKEPSGRNFNERVLMAPHGIPHNPFINTGAIMAASLVKPAASEADRYDYVTSVWSKAAGGCPVTFQNSTYLGERATASRNFCLGYMMEEEGAFPEEHDLQQALESYFMYCSLEMLASDMAVVASTLANGGVCPLTNARVFSSETVQHCLTLMLSCGMYDYSGEWAFTVGVPTKSGVSGVLCVVIPGVAGICTFSPRLDKLGNSVRGMAFCQELSQNFSFHFLDKRSREMNDLSNKTDLTKPPSPSAVSTPEKRQKSYKANLGKKSALSRSMTGDPFNLSSSRELTPGREPVGGITTKQQPSLYPPPSSPRSANAPVPLSETFELGEATALWFAAAAGDDLRVMYIMGCGIDVRGADYDKRSALHLAASNGHFTTALYLLALGADIHFLDRHGNSAIDDARREGHGMVLELLLSYDKSLDRGGDAKMECAPQCTPADAVILYLNHFGANGESGSSMEGAREILDSVIQRSKIAHNAAAESQKSSSGLTSELAPIALKSVQRQLTADRTTFLKLMKDNGISPDNRWLWVCSHIEEHLPMNFTGNDLNSLLRHPADYRCLVSRALIGHVVVAGFAEFVGTLKLLVEESSKVVDLIDMDLEEAELDRQQTAMDSEGKPDVAVSVHTIDSQRFSYSNSSSRSRSSNSNSNSNGSGRRSNSCQGKDDADVEMLAGDLCRPLLYALACELTDVDDHDECSLPRSPSMGLETIRSEAIKDMLTSPLNRKKRGEKGDGDNSGSEKSRQCGIHEFVGHEASGEMNQFDFLNPDSKPYNSLTHAGSLLTTACVMAVDESRRASGCDDGGVACLPLYEKFLLLWREITGKGKGMETDTTEQTEACAYCEETFAELQLNADVTNGIWYVMQANGNIPDGVTREGVLETFHKLHCLKMTMKEVAAFAATLATGGISPVTNKRVLHADTVHDLNSMMFACGMGKESGEFSFNVGVPALGTRSENKASVVMLVVPDVMGVCYYDRFLEKRTARQRRIEKRKQQAGLTRDRETHDEVCAGGDESVESLGVLGASVQGQLFCRQFSESFRFHLFNDDHALGSNDAAFEGDDDGEADSVAPSRRCSDGAPQEMATQGSVRAPHEHTRIASMNLGQLNKIRGELIGVSAGVGAGPARAHSWRDAKRASVEGEQESDERDLVLAIATAVAAAEDGEEATVMNFSYDPCAFWHGGDEMCSLILEAAQSGDLGLIRQLHANGISLSIADYDLRTAGHLACSEGNLETVKYLHQHGVDFNFKDRWGRTALDDALQANHQDTILFLRTGRLRQPSVCSQHESILATKGVLGMPGLELGLVREIDN